MTDTGSHTHALPTALVAESNGRTNVHSVKFYEDDQELAEVVGGFLVNGLRNGEKLVVIATQEHGALFEQELSKAGYDAPALLGDGRFAFLDAHSTLASFMRDGLPDPGLFEAAVGAHVAAVVAHAGGARVRAYGEMVDILWQAGHHEGALQLEALWNDLQTRYSFSLFCAYAMSSFYHEPHGLERVSNLHTNVHANTERRLREEIRQREKLEESLRATLDRLRARETELAKSHEDLQAREHRVRTSSIRARQLLRVTSAIADAVSSRDVYAAVVDQVAEVTHASSIGLWLVDGSARTARLVRARGYAANTQSKIEVVPLDGTVKLPVIDSIRQAEPVCIPSQVKLLELYPHLHNFVSPDRRYRVAALPLLSRARVLGALALTIEGDTPPDDDELEFLRLIARYAGQAIERLRLLEAEQRSRAAADAAASNLQEARARAEQLYNFADAVVEANTIESVFEAALVSIETAVNASRSAVLTYGQEDAMRFRAWHHLSDAYRTAVDGHSPWTRETIDAKPVLIADAANDPAVSAYRDIFAGEGIRALAFIPLLSRGRLLGKFMVYYDQPHEFTTQEIATATAIANHLASVMSRFEVVAHLEETLQQNELFAGVLAHDLRNPLSAIMSGAQLLQLMQEGEQAGAEQRNKPIGRILNSGKRMGTMINQLLDLARSRSGGGIGIHPVPGDLAEVCANAIAELELGNPDWQIRLVSAGDSKGTWDADRLLQSVSNLVANAGQHGSPSGAISVEIDGTDPARVTLSVHNDGEIDTAVLPVLFDPFRRARSRQQASSGLGLGLFIVREIVHAHGGSVDVRSNAQQGTRISLCIPRQGPLQGI